MEPPDPASHFFPPLPEAAPPEEDTPLQHTEPAVLHTGSLRLDLALGTGGFPRSRMIEISGPPSSGKTTLCLHLIAETQTNGGSCAFIDADQALDPRYAAQCGIFVDRLLVSQPLSSEQAFETAEILAQSGAVALIIIDSLAALSPQAEISGVLGKSFYKTHDRLLTRSLHTLSNAICCTGTVIVFTNQLRRRNSTTGPIRPNRFNLAVNLHTALRLELQRVCRLEEKGQVIGERIRIRIGKNKLAASFHPTDVDIMYNEGICKSGEILDVARQLEIVTFQNRQYLYQDIGLGEDRQEVIAFLRQNSHISEEIEETIRRRFFHQTPVGI